MAGKHGKEVEVTSKIHDRPKSKSRKKSKTKRQKGNGKTKIREVQNSEGGKETSRLSKSTQTENELFLDQKIDYHLSKNQIASSPVPLKLGPRSEPIKHLNTNKANESVHSPDLVLLKKTPKDERNSKEENWTKKHFEGTIRLGHGTTETDIISCSKGLKGEVPKKANAKRRSKVKKNPNLDDSYDVVIESITYV